MQQPIIAALSDMIFNVGNIIVWACCFGASVTWDERVG
jgi:hypothetical protein